MTVGEMSDSMLSNEERRKAYAGRDNAVKRATLAKPIGASAYGFVSRLLRAGGYVNADAE